MHLALDCFNTLVDDFDDAGDEWGLGCVADIALNAGLYTSTKAFNIDYKSRRPQWFPNDDEKMLKDRLLDCFPSRPDVVDQILAVFMERYLPTLRATPGALEFVDYWRGAHPESKIVIVSNHFEPGCVHQVLDRFGYTPYLDVIISSADFGKKKPHPTIYAEALRLLGNPDPAEVTFIGDSLQNDVIAPQQAGMKAIHLFRDDERPGLKPAPEGIRVAKGWKDMRRTLTGR